MGQSGVEPDPTNAMWLNRPGRFDGAKHQAHNARTNGQYASAHSIMLSAYITALGGSPVEGQHPVKFFLLAMWHAFCMFIRRNELNHNQLDVWLQFMLKLRARLPFFKTPSVLQVRWYPQFDRFLLDGAERELELSRRARAKPHQGALALMTYAEITYAVNFRAGMIEDRVSQALALEKEIRAEEQPMGLRQFVRVLRKAGELYAKPELSSGGYYTSKARGYLEKALALAQGEANCPDQVSKIQAILRAL